MGMLEGAWGDGWSGRAVDAVGVDEDLSGMDSRRGITGCWSQSGKAPAAISPFGERGEG